MPTPTIATKSVEYFTENFKWNAFLSSHSFAKMMVKRVKSLSWPFRQFLSSEQTQTKEVETWGDNVIKIPVLYHPKTMFMLYQITIAHARKPYRIGLLFTGHMRTMISSEATPHRSWKWIITYRIAFCATLWRSVGNTFSCRHEKICSKI